MSSIFLKYLT